MDPATGDSTPTPPENQYDRVYNQDDSDELVVIVMTRRQWWHLDDWRATHPDRYPNRAAERRAGELAIENAKPLSEFLAEHR